MAMTIEQATACLDSGTCTIVGKTMLNIFTIVIPIVSAFLLALLFVVLWKTPAMTFLKAIITGRSVTYVTNRSQQGKFLTGKVSSEGMLEISGVGPAIISENSHTIEQISGRPIFVLFGEFAATVPLWWAAALEEIKTKAKATGLSIKTATDFGKVVGKEFDSKTSMWVYKKPEWMYKEGEEATIPIHPFKTINISDLSNMFPFNITPALVESRTTHLLAKKLKFWQSLTPQFIITGALALVIMVIAAYLAYKFFGGGPDVNVITDSAGKYLGTTTETLNG